MPNRPQSVTVTTCVKEEYRDWGNLINGREMLQIDTCSMPATLEAEKIAGLWEPRRSGSPIVCEEEATGNSSNHMNVPAHADFDYEDAGTKWHLESKRKIFQYQSFVEKTERKPRKKNKKKKQQHGHQRGKEHHKTTQPQRPNKPKQPAPAHVNNAIGIPQQRANQPNMNGHGNGSDSEDDNRGRQEGCSGHYVGMVNDEVEPSDEEEEMSEEGENSPVGEGVAMVVDIGPPPWQPQCNEEGIARIVDDMKNGVNFSFLKFAQEITRLCVHIAYKDQCVSCPEAQCPKVRKFLEYVKKGQADPTICKIVDLGLFLHAVDCSDSACPVWNCDYWKNWLSARHDRRCIKGKVIHSTTTLFKENDVVYEDRDYTFLEKALLGKGTFGDAWRVWFFSPVHQREADIVLKEARYNLEEEAKIHHIIRQNHPNLLGAMTLIKLDTPRNAADNQRPVHGYILMERGECTLFHRKREYQRRGERGLPPRDAFFYFYQVLEGLRYLHQKGIVHKDVKDLNVLLFNGGQLAKLSDWDGSIFVRNEAELVRTSSIERKGTRGFCAMEVYNRSCHGFPADIYSAAAMLLEIIFGGIYADPGDAPDESIAFRQRKDRKQYAINALKREHLELGHLIEKCLSDEPSERPTAHELVQNDLLKFEQDFRPSEVEAIVPGDQPQFKHQEFRHLADIDGEGGEAVRARFMDIKGRPSDDVVRMMDTLVKVLPSENLPQSSTWEGIIAQATQDEADSHEDMDTS